MSVLTLLAVCCIAVISVRRLQSKRAAALQADTVSVSSDISVSTDVSDHITSEEHSESSTHTEPGTRPVETRC